MWRRTLLPIVAVAAALTIAPLATAGGHQKLGRHLGWGWGDGYHAPAAASPRRAAHGKHGNELPWWAMPAGESELLLTPATPSRAIRSAHPAGPSLFRQPGEGSSVIIADEPGS